VRRQLTFLLVVAAFQAGSSTQAQAQTARGLRLAISAGAFGSLTQLASTNDVGLGGEITPEFRFGSGIGVGVGFRYVRYPEVRDHGAIHLDLRKTWSGTRPVAPVVGLRITAFYGGDDEGDDPYLGVGAGPLAGFERRLGPRTSVQVLGTILAINAIFRSPQVLPGIQVGVVLR